MDEQLSMKYDYLNRKHACINPSIIPIQTQTLSFIPDQSITVVRDDLLCGGTKSRLLLPLLDRSYDEYVYHTLWYGGLQIALIWTINLINQQSPHVPKRVTILTPDPYPESEKAYTKFARELGATIIYIPNTVDEYHFVRSYMNTRDGVKRYLVPSRFKIPIAIDLLSDIASNLLDSHGQFDEVWCCVGSGCLINALQKSGIGKTYYGLCVFGTIPDIHDAIPILPSISIYQPCHSIPPFPSSSHYDAKVFDYIKTRPGKILFWNVM